MLLGEQRAGVMRKVAEDSDLARREFNTPHAENHNDHYDRYRKRLTDKTLWNSATPHYCSGQI
jgi:hypothetical protein